MKKRLQSLLSWPALVVSALLVLALLGGLAAGRQTFAMVAALVVLIIGATLCDPLALPMASMVTLVVVERVGGASLNLSTSDFVLFLAFWVAVLFTQRPFSLHLRAMLWLTFVYQVSALFTVVGNPYRANAIEWFHAWLLTGGALVVGWSLGRDGRASAAIKAVLATTAVIAVLVITVGAQQFASTGTVEAVYIQWPFYMNKNFTGSVLAFMAVVLYARPLWLRISGRASAALLALFILALFATQSRQGMVGLGVGIVVIALRPDPDRRRSRLPLFAIPPAMIYVILTVQDQLASGDQFNSTFQRLTWFQQALTIWEPSPWYGIGLRWWVAGRSTYAFQPPNAIIEVLTSVGIIGLVGFLIMMLGTLYVAWRMPVRYGTTVVAVFAARLAQSQLDLFWVSIQASLPFVIAGLCLGAAAHATPPHLKRSRRRSRLQPNPPHLSPVGSDSSLHPWTQETIPLSLTRRDVVVE